jgi:hypothetical protein
MSVHPLVQHPCLPRHPMTFQTQHVLHRRIRNTFVPGASLNIYSAAENEHHVVHSRRVGRGSDLHLVLPSRSVSRHNIGRSARRYCFTSSKSARCSSLRHTPDHSDSADLHIPHGESELPDWWTSRARIVQPDPRIDPFHVARPDLPILNWTSLVFTASALTEVGRLCHAPNLRTALL